jgi:hypothetical protein
MASAGIREVTAAYVAELRGLGLGEAEIQWQVVGTNLAVARKMGILAAGESIPAELYQAISLLVKDVMEQGI